ncbi:KilA-N domain-containing protein [Labrys sp. KB_33_2]|uniref:KilA-N domain-containing protein n=1 Tax=Labrys sp. KB_33_2 TaxID=3237479 RepID=UPI003F91F5B4
MNVQIDSLNSRNSQILAFDGRAIRDRGDMLSLTDMWKAGGSDPQQAPAKWRALPTTKSFVEHVEVTIGKSDTELFKVQNGGKSPGTFAHWQIALAYAKYLSPEFHVWCNTVVRERMEGGSASIHPAAPAPSSSAHCAREARLSYNHYMKMARMMKIEGNQAVISASNAVKSTVGIDMMAAMGVTHLIAPSDNAVMNATVIGRELGKGARDVNIDLTRLGYQTAFRDSKGHLVYEPTAKGKVAGGYMADTGKRHSNGTPVRQLMWTTQTLEALRAELQMEKA